MSSNFFTNEQFEENAIIGKNYKIDKPLKWKELPTDTIYLIHSVKEVEGKYGKSLIVELSDKDGNTVSVWASGRVMREISKTNLKIADWYIRPQGLKQTDDNQKQYYDFTMSSRPHQVVEENPFKIHKDLANRQIESRI